MTSKMTDPMTPFDLGDFLDAIAYYLRHHGFSDVTVEYPGCIRVWAEDLVDHPGYAWWFGTANETWGGDLQDGTGEAPLDRLDTGVPSDETNPLIVAYAIERVLTEGK